MKLTAFVLSLTAFLINVASVRSAVSGADVTVLTGQTATLTCEVTIPGNVTGVAQVWKDGSEMLYVNKDRLQADAKRMSVSVSSSEMTLTIRDVTLEDEKEYTCGLNGISPPHYSAVHLTVNQNPQRFYVTNTGNIPVDGGEETIALCTTNGSKPEPEMWFTDYDGNKVDLVENPEVVFHENGLVDKEISLKTTFYKNDNEKVYKCHVRKADGQTDSRDTEKLNVRYSPSVTLDGIVESSSVAKEEAKMFQATCSATGNPKPIVQWRFIPDDANFTLASGELIPSNFRVSSEGSVLTADNLVMSTKQLSNNGTFICRATNGVGDAASASFSLGVYAAPVTTVATTAALKEMTTKQKETTAAFEPRAAGSDAAVIGGVVAVAVFVLIVAIILIARYFMSHKGTYHTKEMKPSDTEGGRLRDEEMLESDEDDEAPGDLRHKKRTEYFM